MTVDDVEDRQVAEDRAVTLAARALMRSVLDLLNADPHQWSERGCATCRTISGLVGEPFGCNLYAERKAGRRRG